MATTAEALLTADEFAQLPDPGYPTELVRGRIVPLNLPAPRHGQICGKTTKVLWLYLATDDQGHVVTNDSGVVTEHDPDTVRGGDVAFYSYARVPKGPFPAGYLAVSPNAIFEVRSPTDRWSAILIKVGEYLAAGVTLVCVLDDATETAHVYRDGQAAQVFGPNQELTLPEVLPGFKAVVKEFFE